MVSRSLWLALVCCLWAPSSSAQIVFHAEHDFVGSSTSVDTPSLNLCLRVSCLDHPVRSISWLAINEYLNAGVTNEDLQVSFFANTRCVGAIVSYGIHPNHSQPVFDYLVGSVMIQLKNPNDAVVSSKIPTRDLNSRNASKTAFCHKHMVPDRLDEPFVASITLHELPNGGSTATFALTSNQQCYNFDFAAASITWSNVPTWSTLVLDSSRLIVYSESDCNGDQAVIYVKRSSSSAVARPKSLMLEQYSLVSLKKSTTPALTINNTPVRVPPFNGSITFTYGLMVRKYAVREADQCHRIATTNLSVTNITWANLPTVGRVYGSRTVMMVYEDADCQKRASVLLGSETNIKAASSGTDALFVQSFMLLVNHNESVGPTVIAENFDSQDQTLADGSMAVPARSQSKKSSWLKWLLVGVGGLVGGVVVWVAVNCRRTALEQLSTSSRMLDEDNLLRSIRIAIEDIELEVVLGVTASSVVYLATTQKHSVIVKKLLPELATSPLARQNMIDEVKITSQLDHPKIVRLIGIFWTPMAMGTVHEYVGGGDLATLLATHGHVLSWTKTQQGLPSKLRIAMDVAEALMVLHSFDPPLIHGALTTKNVLVGANGVAKVWNITTKQTDASASQNVEDDIVAFGALLLELDVAQEIVQQEKTSPSRQCCSVAIIGLARRCMNPSIADDSLTAIKVFSELHSVNKQFPPDITIP